MPQAQQAEAKATEAEALFPANLAEAQERNAALMTRANDLMVKTAQAIWESQTDLFRLEAEQAAKALVPPKLGEDPAAAISAYCDQWHQETDRMIAHMRRVNDLVRDYGWQLFEVYAEGFRQAEKQFPVSPRRH